MKGQIIEADDEVIVDGLDVEHDSHMPGVSRNGKCRQSGN